MPPEVWLHFTVRFVHLLAMAVWIGGAAVAPLGMRRELAAGGQTALCCVRRLSRATTWLIAAALITLVTGAWMILLSGGWSAAPTRIRVGLALTILVFAIGATAARPTLDALRKAAEHGADTATIEPLRRRFVVITTLEMSLRIAVLALMVFPV